MTLHFSYSTAQDTTQCVNILQLYNNIASRTHVTFGIAKQANTVNYKDSIVVTHAQLTSAITNPFRNGINKISSSSMPLKKKNHSCQVCYEQYVVAVQYSKLLFCSIFKAASPKAGNSL